MATPVRGRIKVAAAVFALALGLGLVLVAEWMFRARYREDVALVRDPDHRLTIAVGEVNHDGVRTDRAPEDFHPEDFNVIYLGDSFVYGLKQYPRFALPAQLEARLRAAAPGCRVNVANFGWASASPYLSARQLEDIGRKYSPDLVLLGVDMTDFHDDLKYRHLIERPNLLYRVGAHLPGWLVFLKKRFNWFPGQAWALRLHERLFGLPRDRFFCVNGPLEETRKWTGSLVASIERIARYSREELGAEFAVTVFPRGFQYSRRETPKNWEQGLYEVMGPHSLAPFAFFEEQAARWDFPVASLLSAFQETDEFPTTQHDDPHWTVGGGRVAAEAVHRFLLAEDLLPCGAAPDP